MPGTDPSILSWGHDALTVEIDTAPERPPALVRFGTGGNPTPSAPAQPLVELLVAGRGRARSGTRYADTAVGAALRLTAHATGWTGDVAWLDVDLAEPAGGPAGSVAVRVRFESRRGVPAARVVTTVTNTGTTDTVLHAVSSLATGAFVATAEHVADLVLVTGSGEWLGEGRWSHRPLRPDLLPDVGLRGHGQDARGCVPVTSEGCWSSGRWLPTGGLLDTRTGRAWAWQVEHNGGWHYELGERRDGVYLALFGPTDLQHQWRHRLAPGESFESVPISLAVGSGWDGAVGALTAHRRASRRPHPDTGATPVVFNDYMNTLMGDPTTEKLLPLVTAAAAVGADYFCIDAGWYDEDGDWWDSVGEWEPSKTRFPGGIGEVLDAVRDAGMVPGLWLEPEVVGVRSPLADRLPPEAFFLRSGQRQVEDRRLHLDLRHPAARAHLDAVVDRLVRDHGIGYLKLDYNINPGAGTEHAAESAGDGLLGHNRAHLRWLDGVLDRHPGLVLENCSSGAMRMDWAMLSRLQLQSTSDQQDPVRYPPVAASAPVSMPPEQAASWAYPQPEMDDELLAFTLCTSMLGRLYLSGQLDRMTAAQRELVAQGVRAHRRLRPDIAAAVPLWPLELPGWADSWVALGLRAGPRTHLTLWRRPGAPEAPDVPLPHLRGRRVVVRVAYPADLPDWRPVWDPTAGVLRVAAATPAPSARTFTLTDDGPA